MEKGKYQAARKRKKRINWTGVIFWLILLALLIVGIVLLCRSCGGSGKPSENISPTVSTTEPIVPTTDITEPETDPTEPTKPTDPTEPTKPTGPTERTPPPGADPDDDPVEEPTLEPEYDSELGQSVVAIAKASLGKPYRHGGEGPDDFDTTGFVVYCFRENGISVPRSLAPQFEYGAPVPKDALKPGDVVFFFLENPGEAEYVGIYVGDGKFIAVSTSQNAVLERDMGSNYYAERYVGARRYS